MKLWKAGLLPALHFAVATMDSRVGLTFVFPSVASWTFWSYPGRKGLESELSPILLSAGTAQLSEALERTFATHCFRLAMRLLWGPSFRLHSGRTMGSVGSVM
jgi:hypothetical protein